MVPQKPSEIDSVNEAWALVRKGKELKIRFEDWEPGVPQIFLIVGSAPAPQEKDDDEEEEGDE